MNTHHNSKSTGCYVGAELDQNREDRRNVISVGRYQFVHCGDNDERNDLHQGRKHR